MKWVIALLLLMPVFLIFQAWSQDEALQTKLHLSLKQALDIGTHDASLQVDQDQLELGTVRFLNVESQAALRSALSRQLKLDSQLRPLPDSIWKDEIQIVHFERVEGGQFPRVYNSGEPYYYTDNLQGPSIVAIARVKHPRYYGISDDREYVIGSSHEYAQ